MIEQEGDCLQFQCVCGQKFKTKSGYISHTIFCTTYCMENSIDIEVQKEQQAKYLGGLQTANLQRQQNAVIQQEEALTTWKLAGHTCETCGKVMEYRYGSGRFCCRACANTRHHSEETKNKIKTALTDKLLLKTEETSIKNEQLDKTQKVVNRKKYNQYVLNPKICVSCGQPIPYINRENKTCGNPNCLHSLRVRRSLEMRQNKDVWRTVKSQYKFGTYRGYECDSSWELAFLLYYLDQGYTVFRNRKGFSYTYKERTRTFFPDFIINGVYYEIKGKL